jgi:hypothetical protein
VLDESNDGAKAATRVERFVEGESLDIVVEHLTSGFQ